MARKYAKDRGIVEKPLGSGKWWVRVYEKGHERWHRCDSKSQARALYGRLKADAGEGNAAPQRKKTMNPVLLKDYS
jgi:hypothetical protein